MRKWNESSKIHIEPNSLKIEKLEDRRILFKERLKEYYLQNKALGMFKQGDKFTAKDILIVANSLNWYGDKSSTALRSFWGVPINIPELNEVLTEQGFFE